VVGQRVFFEVGTKFRTNAHMNFRHRVVFPL